MQKERDRQALILHNLAHTTTGKCRTKDKQYVRDTNNMIHKADWDTLQNLYPYNRENTFVSNPHRTCTKFSTHKVTKKIHSIP